MFQKLFDAYKTFVKNKPHLKDFIENTLILLGCTFSAFLAAYTFRSFIIPSTDLNATPLITGGVSGLSQTLNRFFDYIHLFDAIENKTMQALLYFIFNIPIFVLGYTKIGKRFATFSLIHVMLTSLFIEIIPNDLTALISISDQLLSRAIAAGLLQGLSSSIAYLMEISSGGLDVVTYYFANVKSTSVGKYALFFNTVVLILFTLVFMLSSPSSEGALNSVLFSIIYFFTTSKIIDTINVRNKKTQLQIITKNDSIAKTLMENFFHGCTIVPAKGGYTNSPRFVIYMVVSSSEAPRVVKLVRAIDPESFIDESYSHQVYGKFYVKPIK
jgi:uncharacterized membrane-anchored protein YitT (DUF2179 family)